MTLDACDEALSSLRNRVDDLGVRPAIWSHRTEPDAHSRRCASHSVDAIDAMLTGLHAIRARPVGEIRAADDAAGQRVDARRADRGADGVISVR